MEKVVLAYSGGLDTSVSVRWIQEKYGLEVVTLTIDLGQERELDGVRERALKSGAVEARLIDAKATFVEHFIWPGLQAGAVYEDSYYLATALGRPLIAWLLVDTAHEVGADRRRARLDRQGQRSGPVRRLGGHSRSRTSA